ncbi:MAG TPA: hypothetical protein VHZ81_07875 [Galbitalea sp.]|jgi:hypothetical protein|nr:hypothetical protein [Galbitalea sp.]
MTRRGILIAGAAALAFAIAEAAVLPATITVTASTNPLGLLVALFGVLCAGIAGRVILGVLRVHRYSRAGIPILAAISGLAFESAASSWLISQDVVLGRPAAGIPAFVVVGLIIGAVAYLAAAFVYGFAATGQGVRVGARVGLLLLLLLAVLPYLNVLGAVGLIITAVVRKPGALPTPGLAAASE